ncbi:MAG: class I SAM-dependent methyltransferase [Lachnospiraceae bacterium]|nr:class I SAM-dependent methyltransferase [Lachnospiraceae bacterium]
MSNWKKIWDKKQANPDILLHGTQREIFMELKKSNGFDVIDDAVSYQAFYGQCQEILRSLSRGGDPVESIFEVGCGSGANLYLYEQAGLKTGGIDYSSSLMECARKVLRSEELLCVEARDLPTDKKYDAVFSNSVFSYFEDEAYARQVLEKMYVKTNHSIGLIDIHDIQKKEAFESYRRKNVENYEERYKDLPKFFYKKEFFTTFASEHNMDISFSESAVEGYWNNDFVFSCYLYKRK